MAARKHIQARKAPGRNVEEWERSTDRIRLPRTLMISLRDYAAEHEMKVSEWLPKMLASMITHPDWTCAEVLEEYRELAAPFNSTSEDKCETTCEDNS